MLRHVFGEILDRAVDAFGEQHRHVVRRFHHQHLQRVVDRDLGAGREAHLGRRLRRGVARNREQRVERDAVLLDRAATSGRAVISLVTEAGYHGIGRVLGAQHFAGVRLDQESTRRHAPASAAKRPCTAGQER